MVQPSVIAGTLDPEAVFRFTISIDGVYIAAFTEFQMPDLNVETLDVTEGGQNTYVHKLPVRLNVGTAVMKQGVTPNLALLEWYMLVVNGNIADAMREVSVKMYSPKGQQTLAFNFRRAYPIKWVAPTLNTEQNSIALEELHIVHHGFTIEDEYGVMETSSTS